MRAYERLLNYVGIHTASNSDSDTVPSTRCQFDLARYLLKEMKDLGIEDAKAAIEEAGMEALEVPIRGGTDGAQLSFRGLPCPNLGAGGFAFHGPYEHCTAEGMDEAAAVLLGIIKRYAK